MRSVPFGAYAASDALLVLGLQVLGPDVASHAHSKSTAPKKQTHEMEAPCGEKVTPISASSPLAASQYCSHCTRAFCGVRGVAFALPDEYAPTMAPIVKNTIVMIALTRRLSDILYTRLT